MSSLQAELSVLLTAEDVAVAGKLYMTAHEMREQIKSLESQIEELADVDSEHMVQTSASFQITRQDFIVTTPLTRV
jgi:hypothetical protein